MSKMLHDRQKEILKYIVQLYIKNKRPVSSDEVLEQFKIKASSATIRNDMQKLQKLGFVYQQHSSGGRIPSDSALKIYFQMIKEAYNQEDTHIDIPKKYKFYDLNLMFQSLADLISKSLEGLVIFEYPNPKYVYIKRVTVTPLMENNNVITVLTNLGLVVSRAVEIYGLPPSQELETVLNNGLIGKTFYSLFMILSAPKLEIEDIRITNFMEILEQITSEFNRKKYIISGLEKIIAKCEPDINAIETLALMVENDRIKEQILKNLDFSNDIKISFGEDFNSKALKNMVFFYTTYNMNSHPLGKVFFITDKYCDYEKNYVILKEYVSRLSEIISKNL